MKYSAEPVNETGIRFRLEEGNIEELYKKIDIALRKHYSNQGLITHDSPRPDFKKMPFKQTRLPSREVESVDVACNIKPCGHINLNYFAGGRNGKKKDNVDYRGTRAYTHTDPKTTYESITLFFNTFLPNIPSDLLEWARNQERDIFLEKVVSGELP
jgi:hypothetical protein